MADFRMRGFDAIPPVIKNLVILNSLVLFAEWIFGKTNPNVIDNLFALHDVRSFYFRPHQLITHLFMHANLGHLFFNMFALWMFGSVLENLWGSKRFLIFYMACGLGAALLHLGVLYYELTPIVESVKMYPLDQQPQIMASQQNPLNQATVGASGAVFGCLAAFGYLFPNSLLYIYALFPIKAKWFVLIYAGIELFMGVQNSAGDNVAHWAHLGGALVGFLLVLYWNRTNRRRFY